MALIKSPMTLEQIAQYASGQADMAQVRKLKFMNAQAHGDELPKLYDDFYYQPVLDIIRQELLDRLAEMKKAGA